MVAQGGGFGVVDQQLREQIQVGSERSAGNSVDSWGAIPGVGDDRFVELSRGRCGVAREVVAFFFIFVY